MKKLAIVTTHPIQYYAPVFKLMAEHINLCVFYTWGKESLKKNDPGFGKTVQWDIDLLDGYKYVWLRNTSNKPGSHHFKGIINPDITREIQAWQPDAVLIFGWAYHSHLTVLRFFNNKIPIYFRGDSTLLDEKPGLKNIARVLLLTWVYKHIDIAFYTGINNKAYFKKLGLNDSQLIFVPHAVDNERFGESKIADAAKLRAGLKISPQSILILFAGKFEEKKAPLLLLNAFFELNNSDCHLLFIGNGKLESELKDKAQKKTNVHFMAFQNQSQMPAVYQACDLFCLPSQGPGESWGLAVNEAMACRKAVLVSDKVGCAANLVQPGHNGYVFKNNDLGSLIYYLNTLTESKELLKEFGERSGQIVKAWNFTNTARTIEKEING